MLALGERADIMHCGALQIWGWEGEALRRSLLSHGAVHGVIALKNRIIDSGGILGKTLNNK